MKTRTAVSAGSREHWLIFPPDSLEKPLTYNREKEAGFIPFD